MTITTVLDQLTFAPYWPDEIDFLKFIIHVAEHGGKIIVEDDEQRKTLVLKPHTKGTP